MELTVNLAGKNITISFIGQAEKAISFCNQYFRNFLYLDQRGDAKITVSVLKEPNHGFPVRSTTGNPVFEQLLSTPDVAAWLRKGPDYREDFPISERTISSFCLDGLLLFDPDTTAGRIYLLKQGPGCFKPLYRLFWMYFAQVLGEAGGCFIHCAALVKDNEGYLFMGDSGAGKSTIVKLCPECRVFSDDSPIFFRQNGEYRVYPSPYHQIDPVKGLDKEVIQMSAKVKDLYFLIKDNRVFLERISKKEAFSVILKRYIHFFPYLSTQAKSAIFNLIYETCNRLPTYNLHFYKDQDVSGFITGR